MEDFTKFLVMVTLSLTVLSTNVYAEEFECHPPNNFSCGDGKCIPPKWVCDTRHDCDNKLDEENCPSTCKDDEFYCGDDQCISNRWVCDKEIDCRSRLDEMSCDDGIVSECEENEMNCGNGDCIKLDWKCDGEEDCSNGEDERECDDNVLDPNMTTNGTTVVGQTVPTDEVTTFQQTTQPSMMSTSVPRRRKPNSRRNNRKRLTTIDPFTWGQDNEEGTVDSREERRRARKEKKKQAAADKETNEKPGSDVNSEQMEEPRTTPPIVGVQSNSVSTRHTLAVILGVSIGFLVMTVLLSLIGHCLYRRKKRRQESVTEHYLLQNKD